MSEEDVYISENEKAIDKALELAMRYGQIDGDHHKTWVIDQMVRALTGPCYPNWVKDACEEDGNPHAYGWDEGIAP